LQTFFAANGGRLAPFHWMWPTIDAGRLGGGDHLCAFEGSSTRLAHCGDLEQRMTKPMAASIVFPWPLLKPSASCVARSPVSED
jgi:hypothetical protein